MDVVLPGGPDRPLDGGDHSAVVAHAVFVEDAKIDDAGSGCHAFEGAEVGASGRIMAIARDDSGHMRAVSELVGCGGAVVHKTLAGHDAALVCARQAEIGFGCDSAVDHRNADAFSVVAVVPYSGDVSGRGGVIEVCLQRAVR